MACDMIETLLLILVALAVFFAFTVKVKRGVLRALKDGTILSDASEGAWTATWSAAWVVRFGEEWRARYGETWAIGLSNDPCDVWVYSP